MGSKLSDLIMQLSYYQGGGKDHGNRDIDKVDKIASTVGDIGKDHVAFKKASLENKKAEQGLTPMSEIRGYGKLPSEQEDRAGFDAASENMRRFQDLRSQFEQDQTVQKKRFTDTLSPEEQAYIPQELVDSQAVGQEPQMPEPFASKRQEYMQDYPGENPDLSLDQYKELQSAEALRGTANMRNGGKQYQSLLPAIASGYADRDFVKSIMPELAEGQDISIGELNIRKDLLKQNKSLSSIEGERKERRDERGDDRVLRVVGMMQNDPIAREAKKQSLNMGQLGSVLALARGGNTVAAAAMGMKMARAMGEVGVATDSDIVRYVQSGRLDRRGADILSRWMTGTPTDASLEEISQIAGVLGDIYKTKIQPVYNYYSDVLSRNTGMSQEEAAFKLGVTYVPPGPQVGEVKRGYKYIGGDPKIPASWEKVQQVQP